VIKCVEFHWKITEYTPEYLARYSRLTHGKSLLDRDMRRTLRSDLAWMTRKLLEKKLYDQFHGKIHEFFKSRYLGELIVYTEDTSGNLIRSKKT